MKRRYKAGDWIWVPLGAEHAAVGIIARACRSRLFGYFFAVPAAHVPSPEELTRLRAGDALAAVLFGGRPIERARWSVIATSLPFDADAWPFPAFASRGAFAQSWQRIRYDAHTLQIVERTAIDAHASGMLADARFADAHEVEALLRRRIAGADLPRAVSVYELRSPLHANAVRAIENTARVQFSTALTPADLAVLAKLIDERPGIELRVHGFRHGFDTASLAACARLQSLRLDVHRLQHAEALRGLNGLRTLRLGAMRVDLTFLDALQMLERLELRGTRALLDPVLRLRSLHALRLENTAPVDFGALASAESLRELVLAHADYDLTGVQALPNVQTLALHALDAAALPGFAGLPKLERLHLHALRNLVDLTPIVQAPALRELRLSAMPHLNVEHFAPLQACAGLHDLHVEVGSRRKEREIYRLFDRGSVLPPA